MTEGGDLDEEERERLADVVRLQPTKNGELGDRWGMEDGSEVHRYLEEHLGDYYYRDEDSLIRATAEAADLIGVEPGIEADTDGDGSVPDVVRVPDLELKVLEVLAGPEDRSLSVVRVLNALRDTYGIDPAVDDVREALQSLKRKGIVDVVYRTVPTFRLAVERDSLTVEPVDESPPSYPGYDEDEDGDEVLEAVESEFEAISEN